MIDDAHDDLAMPVVNKDTEAFAEQGTDAWLEIRKGKFTASEIHRLMGVRGLGQTGMTFIMEKVTEELGGTIPEPFIKAMEHGTITEPFAKEHYAKAFNCTIIDQPFIIAPWCDQAGCSPDGFVVTDMVEILGKETPVSSKLIEIKCPYDPTNHIKHLMLKTPEELKDQKPEYYWQIMMGMSVTDLLECDFVSYSDCFEGKLRMTVLPVYRNEPDIALLKSRIWEAVKIKNEIIDKIKARLK
jgi:putative phage-type endonuclease